MKKIHFFSVTCTDLRDFVSLTLLKSDEHNLPLQMIQIRAFLLSWILNAVHLVKVWAGHTERKLDQFAQRELSPGIDAAFTPAAPWPSHGNSGNNVTQRSRWSQRSAVCSFFRSHEHIHAIKPSHLTDTNLLMHLFYYHFTICSILFITLIAFNLISKELSSNSHLTIPHKTLLNISHDHVYTVIYYLISSLCSLQG